MKKVTQMFGGRESLPVRAVPLVTDWLVTPQELAMELSKPAYVRGLTAYRFWGCQAIPVKADAWGMQHEMLIDIVRDIKRDEQEPDQHRQSARHKSLKGLPAGVFVWLDEFENWYSSTYISPDSVWEEQHRVVGEDEDPEPQFLPKRHDALNLFPISLSDFEPLISEAFETGASPVLAAAALLSAEVADGASGKAGPDAGPAQNTATPAPVVAGNEPVLVSKRTRKRRTWRDVAMPYVVETYRAGKYKTAHVFYVALVNKAGLENSPFTLHDRELFMTDIGQSLAEKTIENAMPEIKAAARLTQI